MLFRSAVGAAAESHRALGSFLPTTLSTVGIDALRAARQAIAAGLVSPVIARPPPSGPEAAEEARVESERGDVLSLVLQESPEVLQLPLELQVRCQQVSSGCLSSAGAPTSLLLPLRRATATCRSAPPPSRRSPPAPRAPLRL